MGLSLPVVKDIVERHGGDIHLTSTPGAGTTFELRSPYYAKTSAETFATLDYDQFLARYRSIL